VKHATEYLTFETPHRRDYVNITDRVEAFVGESGIQHGLVLSPDMALLPGTLLGSWVASAG
jgi:thiamine phosphate synthase YjbQ (UPF0047 family)